MESKAILPGSTKLRLMLRLKSIAAKVDILAGAVKPVGTELIGIAHCKRKRGLHQYRVSAVHKAG